MSNQSIFEAGHFYSPLVDTSLALADSTRIWRDPHPKPGIDFNPAMQQFLLETVISRWMPQFTYPLEASDSATYFLNNEQFSWLDARSLFAFMAEGRPKNVVEVGSGYSTAIMVDVNQRFLEEKTQITCIEPYPRPVLLDLVSSHKVKLIKQRVELLPLDAFTLLDRGDLLFIDSSHVVKSGNDCAFLFLEVLPRLRPGVLIHVHDIFLPFEYPKEWVVDQNRSWNEQYLVEALLSYSMGYRILFGSSYASNYLRAQCIKATLPCPNMALGGGSLWIEKTAQPALIEHRFLAEAQEKHD